MDVSLLAFGAAAHYGSSPSAEERVESYRAWNPGLGIKLGGDRSPDSPVVGNVSAGVFRNSIDRTSCFAGPGVEIGTTYGMQMSLVYISGYPDVAPLTPILGVWVRRGRYSMHAVYLNDAVGFYGEIRL